MYGMMKSKHSQANAPNNEFNIFYDKILTWAQPPTTIHANAEWAANRASNNKGNSMEILMMAIAEAGHHRTLWTIIWVQFMHQHKDMQVEWVQAVDS
jgi:hypothetical protein